MDDKMKRGLQEYIQGMMQTLAAHTDVIKFNALSVADKARLDVDMRACTNLEEVERVLKEYDLYLDATGELDGPAS